MSAESKSVTCFCCGAKDTGPLSVWQSPHYHAAERLFCWIIHKLVPLKDMHGLDPDKDAAKITVMQSKMATFFDQGYSRDIKSKIKGWSSEMVKFQMPGGGQGSMLLHRPPDVTGELPLLYWMHGGGFTVGSYKDPSATAYASILLKAGVPVVLATVEYRLAPQHPFPAAYEDSLHGLGHLLETASLAEKFGYNPRWAHIGGCSAGGNLAASVSASLVRRSEKRVLSVFVDAPMLNPAMDCASYTENARQMVAPLPWLRFCWDSYLRGYPGGKEAAMKDYRVCPQVDPPPPPTPGEGPRFIVVTASGDAFKDEGVEYAQAMKKAGWTVDHIQVKGGHGTCLQFDKSGSEAVFGAWTRALKLRP